MIMQSGVVISDDERQPGHDPGVTHAGACLWEKLHKGLLNKQSFESKLYRENLRRQLEFNRKDSVRRKTNKKRTTGRQERWVSLAHITPVTKDISKTYMDGGNQSPSSSLSVPHSSASHEHDDSDDTPSSSPLLRREPDANKRKAFYDSLFTPYTLMPEGYRIPEPEDVLLYLRQEMVNDHAKRKKYRDIIENHDQEDDEEKDEIFSKVRIKKQRQKFLIYLKNFYVRQDTFI